MKQSVERIKTYGCSDVIIRLGIAKYRQFCEGVLKHHMDGSLLAVKMYDGLCWYYEGTIRASSSVVMELCLNRVIEADIASHTLLRVDGEDVKAIEHDQVLNLSDEGERWEGDVLQNKPFGWGVLYDSENRKKYEGFRLGNVNVCYGRSYYSDNQKVEYEGEIYEGKRWGRGVQYDRRGNTVFEGEWLSDEPVSKSVVWSESNQLLHSCIEALTVCDGCCTGEDLKQLDFSFFPNLQQLTIGDTCFWNTIDVKLIGLKKLKSVLIGESCFRFTLAYMNPKRGLYMRDCPQVKELIIGHASFYMYSLCEIVNNPSLEGIEVGGTSAISHCFGKARLELKSVVDETR